LPELHINNLVAWEVYRIVAGLGENMGLDLMGLLDRLGIKRPLVVLRKLGVIQRIALTNWEKYKGGK